MRPPNGKPLDPQVEKGRPATGQLAAREVRDKPRVLVVDDDRMVRIMVQLGLERSGFDVWLASDGWEAIDLYREHGEDIAVVLLDIRMPGLDGMQTLDALRDLRPGVRACVMSGDLGAYDPEELRRRGAACVLAKPFHLDQLADILRLLVQNATVELLPSGAAGQGRTPEELTQGGANAHDSRRR